MTFQIENMRSYPKTLFEHKLERGRWSIAYALSVFNRAKAKIMPGESFNQVFPRVTLDLRSVEAGNVSIYNVFASVRAPSNRYEQLLRYIQLKACIITSWRSNLSVEAIRGILEADITRESQREIWSIAETGIREANPPFDIHTSAEQLEIFLCFYIKERLKSEPAFSHIAPVEDENAEASFRVHATEKTKKFYDDLDFIAGLEEFQSDNPIWARLLVTIENLVHGSCFSTKEKLIVFFGSVVIMSVEVNRYARRTAYDFEKHILTLSMILIPLFGLYLMNVLIKRDDLQFHRGIR